MTESADPGQYWLVGGVAAELAICLRASSGPIRALLLVAALFAPWLTIAACCLLALALPHDRRRRPGWSNIGGLLRVGAFLSVGWFTVNWVQLDGGVFNQAPAFWIPVAGTALLALVVALCFLAARPPRGWGGGLGLHARRRRERSGLHSRSRPGV